MIRTNIGGMARKLPAILMAAVPETAYGKTDSGDASRNRGGNTGL
jgi:hypothetical protein